MVGILLNVLHILSMMKEVEGQKSMAVGAVRIVIIGKETRMKIDISYESCYTTPS